MASQNNFATLPRYNTQNAFSEQVILHVPSSPHFINISRSKLSIPVLCLSLESKQSSLLICYPWRGLASAPAVHGARGPEAEVPGRAGSDAPGPRAAAALAHAAGPGG